MTDITLNHDKTKALLIHATAASSTKEVAALIGVASPRISEGKDKRWRLPVESASILIEVFGPVRAEHGDYLEAEIWDSFDEYKKQSPIIAAKRQLFRIATVLNDDVKVCEFLDSIELIDTSIIDKDELRQVKLDVVNGLIYHPTFIKWHGFLKSQFSSSHSNFDKYSRAVYVSVDRLTDIGLEESVRYHKNKNDVNFSEEGSLNVLFKEFGIYSVSSLISRDSLGPFASLLYLIGEFTANCHKFSGLHDLPLLDDKYLVGMKLNISDPVQYKPVVLTGNVVWSVECQDFTEPMIFDELGLLPSSIGHFSIDYYRQLSWTSLYSDINIAPDRYDAMKIQLNLTKSMSYHMYFQLGQGCYDSAVPIDGTLDSADGRTIIIKDISADGIFDFISEFADYFELRDVPMVDIKEMIAKNGGFIPGAIYLE